MLTLQALMDPKYELAGPFGTMLQVPCHSKRATRNAKLAEKLKNSQNSGELQPPREKLPSIKTNYHVLTYLQLHYWMTLILC